MDSSINTDIEILNETLSTNDDEAHVVLDIIAKIKESGKITEDHVDFMKDTLSKITFIDNNFIECLLELKFLNLSDRNLVEKALLKVLKYDFSSMEETYQYIIYKMLVNHCIFMNDDKLTSELMVKLDTLEK